LLHFGSFADAAIESGNSEKIILDHYYNAMTEKEASKSVFSSGRSM
jgi:hypothetical protein